MKLIHCADIHLGAGGSSLGHLGITRMAEIKNTFLKIVQLCREEKADYLLIAGDLFDSAAPSEHLVEEVAGAFAAIPDTKVIIAPGNHDYVMTGTCYTRTELWSDNVHIFTGAWSYIEFPEDKVRIFGAGFTSMYQIIPLLDTELEYPKDDFCNIGVLHGELAAGAGESNYNPVTKRQIRESGLDYLALGHIHQESGLRREGGTTYAYPGCHEGRGFDELGEKGIYIGEVEKGSCRMEFRKICKRMYIEENIDISGTGSVQEIVAAIEERLEKQGSNYREYLYKLVLTGRIPDGAIIRQEDIEAALGVFYVKLRDRTQLDVDYESVAKESGIRGIYVRKMLEKIREYQQSGKEQEAGLYLEALEKGYRAF